MPEFRQSRSRTNCAICLSAVWKRARWAERSGREWRFAREKPSSEVSAWHHGCLYERHDEPERRGDSRPPNRVGDPPVCHVPRPSSRRSDADGRGARRPRYRRRERCHRLWPVTLGGAGAGCGPPRVKGSSACNWPARIEGGRRQETPGGALRHEDAGSMGVRCGSHRTALAIPGRSAPLATAIREHDRVHVGSQSHHGAALVAVMGGVQPLGATDATNARATLR